MKDSHRPAPQTFRSTLPAKPPLGPAEAEFLIANSPAAEPFLHAALTGRSVCLWCKVPATVSVPEHGGAFRVRLTLQDATLEPTNGQLARRIALSLFTNGSGQFADRLVLTAGKRGPDEIDLGGWGFEPMVDQIEKILSGRPR